MTTLESLWGEVAAAVATVEDPEYPGVTIVDLGLLESIDIGDDGHVRIELTPTFSGCPALGMIGDDVTRAVQAVDGVSGVEVSWVAAPVWTTDRISPLARWRLARDLTVVVGTSWCPVCDQGPLELVSDVGPSRCRAIRRCTACGEIVEQVRS